MVWLSALRRPWRIPQIVISSISQEFSLNTYFALAVACFVIGMLNFAVPCSFNVFEMIYYLGQERWAAPWGRGQLGGWDAFLDHLQYFGYLLPVLTVCVTRARSRVSACRSSLHSFSRRVAVVVLSVL
jgi:hypothetical protein